MSFDCIVVGAGPGGYVAAARAAQLGLRTAVVERAELGGRCLNQACIPAKTVLRSAEVLAEIRSAGRFGITVEGVVADYDAIQRRRIEVIGTLTSGVRHILHKQGVEIVRGHATVMGAGRLRVGDEDLVARRAIVLATGSVRRGLPGFPYGGRVIGTEEAWQLPELPGRLIVVGAGASGVEIASAYARLGSRVVLLEAAGRVLPTEDAEVSSAVAKSFAEQGIEVHTSAVTTLVGVTGNEVTVTVGGEPTTADWLVVAAGRTADVEGLGLQAAGVAFDDRGLIAVGPTLRSSVPGIWAIGDLVAGPALAHKASAEGLVAVEDAAGLATTPVNDAMIPRVTFCAPNVASFGLTEQEAIDAGHEVTTGRVPFSAAGASTVNGHGPGLIKIVGDRRHGEILGGHVVGTRAAELLQSLVNVQALEGGFPEVARMIHGHPTLTEGIQEAARAADGWLIHG